MKKFLPVLLLLLLVCAATAQEQRFFVPTGDSPALGPPDAPVTVVEFIDFQ